MDLVEALGHLFGQAFSSEVVKFGAAFSLAAYVHGKQLRKSIDDLTTVLRQDLAAQSERITIVEKALGIDPKKQNKES